MRNIISTVAALALTVALGRVGHAEPKACPEYDSSDGPLTTKITAAIKDKLHKPVQVQQWTCVAGAFPAAGWYITALVQPPGTPDRQDAKVYRAVFNTDLSIVIAPSGIGETVPEALYASVATELKHKAGGDIVVEDWTLVDPKVDPPVEMFHARAETTTAGGKLATAVKVIASKLH